MNRNYTPGQWSAFENEEGGFTIVSDMDTETEKFIAFCPPAKKVIPAEQNEANARLLGAAPDLYDALRELTAYMWIHNDEQEGQMILEQCRVALDKAHKSLWIHM